MDLENRWNLIAKNTVLVAADLEGSNNLKNDENRVNFYKYRGNRNNLTIFARKQNFLAKNIKIFCLEACDEENGSIFTKFLEEYIILQFCKLHKEYLLQHIQLGCQERNTARTHFSMCCSLAVFA